MGRVRVIRRVQIERRGRLGRPRSHEEIIVLVGELRLIEQSIDEVVDV